jgi:hypothetical protein
MKLNFRILLILLTAFTGVCQTGIAQPEIVWDTAFGSSYIYNSGISKPTSDGGIVYCCFKMHGATIFSPWIVKFDAGGKWEWDKTYGVEKDGIANDIIQTSDGGYLLTGKILNPDSDYDLWLLKLDEKGDSVWSKSIGGPLYESGTSIVQVSDESYFISGQADEVPGQEHIGAWLLKIDNMGDTLWTRRYSSGDNFSLNWELLVKSGNHVYAGIESIDVDGEGPIVTRLVRFDDNGDTLGTKCLSCSPYNFLVTSLSPVSDGGFILTGMQDIGDNWDLLLLKVNPEGEMEWSETFGGEDWEMGHSVKQTADGGYIIGGTTSSFGLPNNLDAWLIKTDSRGHEVWSETLGGEAENERATNVHVLADNGYYVSGNYNSLFWTARFNTDTSIHNTAVKEDPFIQAGELRQNYPNPFSRATCIEYSVPENCRVRLSVFDLLGKEIICLADDRVSGGCHSIVWDGSDPNGRKMPRGIYYCRMMVQNDDGEQSYSRTNRMIKID